MTKTMKQSIAVTAIIAQLLILFPFNIIPVNAEESAQINDRSTPVLNETVVGTVDFQSFNFLGDNKTGEDGKDYSTTFYYTDDYFAPSAVNPKVGNITDNDATQDWTMLEDISMATCSMDFAVASYTSAVGDVIGESSQSWNNTDYTGEYGFHPENGKAENVIQFLTKCGFDSITPVGLKERPTNDSIGYTLASKEITVWNGTENASYTLVAVGMRGAGYGAEWASNVTIGDPATNALPSNGRHYGFDHSADIVCDGIHNYLSKNNITGNVKYWVTGFSRAAAVANLVAGKLTDDSSSFSTTQDDVYGYTWECPQGAKTQSGNVTNYKNIHNIINAMDAVPKVSPSEFDHQRLGVDYVMPYYKNTEDAPESNETYYKRMYEVLKTIATGVDSKGNADPLLDAVNPANYPFNRPMTIYKMDGSELMKQVVAYALNSNNDTLLKEFGTVEAEHKHKGGLFNAVTYGNVERLLGWDGRTDYKTSTWYIDDFINNLVTVFLTSNAWVGGTGNERTPQQNRATFISNYQNDFRTLFGYFLDFTGPAFLGLVDKLIPAVTSNIGTSLTSGFAWYFVRFYNDPSNTSKKNNLINASKTLAVDVANEMVQGFPDPEMQGITKVQMNAAMRNLAELVINLYSYELSEYDSQYLGTTLRYLNTILCTHEQETVLSWIMSLDPNHINRSYKTLTVPMESRVELHEFRSEYNEEVSANGEAPVVAVYEDGAEIFSKDQRIYKETSGSNLIVRYPASLTIRADVTTPNGNNDLEFKVGDYQIKSETVGVSAGESQFKTLSGSNYTNITNTNKTNARSINNLSDNTVVPMSKYDVLHIWSNGTDAYNTNNNAWHVDKDIYVNTIVEGQFVLDGDITTFTSTVIDDNGTAIDLDELAGQFNYTSTKGEKLNGAEENSHIGRNFTVYVPKITDNHYVEKYFVTDSSDANNKKLSTEVPYPTTYEENGPYSEFSYGDASTDSEILSQTDRVYHVFYSGSPVTPASVTKIIDFNGKMVLATEADELNAEKEDNGKFALDTLKNATYQLNSGKLNSETVMLTSAYSSADVATIKGVFSNEGKAVKKKVTVVPASSVYFNDQLAKETIRISDTVGYSAAIENSVSQGAKEVSGTFYLTFYGTGIDVYCTTHNEGGYVSAAVFSGRDKSECVKNNRIGSAKTVRNYSSENYYNTPSVSFTGLTAGTYTLKLSANENAQYKLDGVRVYNSVEKGSDAEAELNKTDEANATYLNLRSVLLNDEGVGGFTVTNNISEEDSDPSAVSGVLFIDDVDKIVTKSNIDEDGNTAEDPINLYQTQFDVYKGNGPKNEIYLKASQGLTFLLNTERFNQETTKVYVGLSAPNATNPIIRINGNELHPAVKSVMDMYYPVEFDLSKAENDRLSITIENNGPGIVSVTNLKITGVVDLIPEVTNSNQEQVLNATRALFAPVTLKTIRMAANNGIDPEADTVEAEEPAVTENPEETEDPDDGSLVIDEPEVTETPTPSVKPSTPAETGNTMQKVIQSITRSISSFFKSIFRR